MRITSARALLDIGLVGIGLALSPLSAPPAAAQATPPDTAAVFKNYSDMALATYEDTLAGGKALQTAIGDMLTAPTAATLEAARKAWVAARTPYLQSEAFRFTSPIIDAW